MGLGSDCQSKYWISGLSSEPFFLVMYALGLGLGFMLKLGFGLGLALGEKESPEQQQMTV